MPDTTPITPQQAEVVMRHYIEKNEGHAAKIADVFRQRGWEPYLSGVVPWKDLVLFSTIAKPSQAGNDFEQKYVFVLDLNWHFDPYKPLQTELGLPNDVSISYRSGLHVVSVPLEMHSDILSFYSDLMKFGDKMAFPKGGWMKSSDKGLYLYGSSCSFGKEIGADECHGIASFVLGESFPEIAVNAEGYETSADAYKTGLEYAEFLNDTAGNSLDPSHYWVMFLQGITRRGTKAFVRNIAKNLQNREENE